MLTTRGGYALSRSPCDTSIVWHDARCKTVLCWLPRTIMAPKRFSRFPLLASRKTKVKETKSKVSNEHQFRLYTNLLTINRVQEPPVTEHEVATVSATKECISVEDRAMRVMETNSKAAVRGLFLILPYLWHTSEFRNRLITPGRSFPLHQIVSWPPGNRP